MRWPCPGRDPHKFARHKQFQDLARTVASLENLADGEGEDRAKVMEKERTPEADEAAPRHKIGIGSQTRITIQSEL